MRRSSIQSLQKIEETGRILGAQAKIVEVVCQVVLIEGFQGRRQVALRIEVDLLAGFIEHKPRKRSAVLDVHILAEAAPGKLGPGGQVEQCGQAGAERKAVHVGVAAQGGAPKVRREGHGRLL